MFSLFSKFNNVFSMNNQIHNTRSHQSFFFNRHVEKVRSVWWAMLCSVLLEFTDSFHVALILGDPGAVSRVDKMFDLTVNFHHEHFIDPTNCPWVSEDALLSGFPGKLLISHKNRRLVCAFIYLFTFFSHKFVICVKHYGPVYWETREVTGRHKARTVVLYQILFVAHRSVKSWSLLHTLAENCLRFLANSYHMCSVRWS